MVCIVFVSLFLVQPFELIAQSNSQEGSNNGISVSPVKVQRNYKGNDKDKITFTLLNNEDKDIDLFITLKSFKLLNNNQEIFFEPTIEETVLNWIRNFKNSIILKSKEKTEYTLELNISGDSNPGGYLFGIFFETHGNNSEETKVSETIIKQSIGIPLIINVAGVQGISYGQVSLDSYDISYNMLTNSVPISSVVLNNSNQIITPTGVTTLIKKWGIGPDVLSNSFNSEGRLVNSFSLRTFTSEILLPQFTIGEYEANLDFLYGLENNVYSQKNTIIIIPIWIPGIILLIVLFFFFKVRVKYLNSES